jgi:hypothetical protein
VSEQPGRGLDRIGWYVATLHSLLGHDKTAAYIGAEAGDRENCLICAYEQGPDARKREAVIEALMAPRDSSTGGMPGG